MVRRDGRRRRCRRDAERIAEGFLVTLGSCPGGFTAGSSVRRGARRRRAPTVRARVEGFVAVADTACSTGSSRCTTA